VYNKRQLAGMFWYCVHSRTLVYYVNEVNFWKPTTWVGLLSLRSSCDGCGTCYSRKEQCWVIPEPGISSINSWYLVLPSSRDRGGQAWNYRQHQWNVVPLNSLTHPLMKCAVCHPTWWPVTPHDGLSPLSIYFLRHLTMAESWMVA